MLSRFASWPSIRSNTHDLQHGVQVNADSINDISAYASDQDKFSPGEGLDITEGVEHGFWYEARMHGGVGCACMCAP